MSGRRKRGSKRGATSGSEAPSAKRRNVPGSGETVTAANDIERVEVFDLAPEGSVAGTSASAATGTGNRSGVVDFESILKQSFGDDMARKNDSQSSFSRSFEHAEQLPEMVRCGEDDIAFHVPETVKRKIRHHEFVNLAILLKGGVELAELFGGNLLSINDKGQLETRPKTVSDKITNISKWTDAFFIFSSVYLLEYPQRTQEILKYMTLIREAANRNAGFGWRLYDEQFRLRQVVKVQPWGVINSDLWLRCFPSGPVNAMSTSGSFSSAGHKPPACLDFNKGNCQWTACRYTHACSACSSTQHGKWACPNASFSQGSQYGKTDQAHFSQGSQYGKAGQAHASAQSFRGSFRGFRGRSFMRGSSRGSYRGNFKQSQ